MKKKIISIILVVVTIFILCMPAGAANYKGVKNTFGIYRSGDYAALTGNNNSGVTMIATNSSGTEGTITINKTVWFNGHALQKGAIFAYKISSMKEGGTITLELNRSKCDGVTYHETYLTLNYVNRGDNYGAASYKLTGKIHMSGANNYYHIWKIDSLKGVRSNAYSLGCYFKWIG